jgi:predicted dinucleotide-binding enzyme
MSFRWYAGDPVAGSAIASDDDGDSAPCTVTEMARPESQADTSPDADAAIDRRRRVLLGAGTSAALAALSSRPLFAQPAAAKLRLGLVGAGRLGGTIGALWVKAGHPVMFSSRDPQEVQALVDRLGPLARGGTVAEAIAFGEALFFAVPYAALPELGKEHAAALKGKIVLDACNAVAARDGPITDEAVQNGIGITSQKYLAGTRLVRAFNTISYMVIGREANRADPRLPIPIAGDDAEALQVAAALVRDAGFEPVVVGGLAEARRFQMGGPGYGPHASAAELRQKLSLAP